MLEEEKCKTKMPIHPLLQLHAMLDAKINAQHAQWTFFFGFGLGVNRAPILVLAGALMDTGVSTFRSVSIFSSSSLSLSSLIVQISGLGPLQDCARRADKDRVWPLPRPFRDGVSRTFGLPLMADNSGILIPRPFNESSGLVPALDLRPLVCFAVKSFNVMGIARPNVSSSSSMRTRCSVDGDTSRTGVCDSGVSMPAERSSSSRNSSISSGEVRKKDIGSSSILSRFSSSSSRSRMIVGGHESLLCSSLYGIANLDSVVLMCVIWGPGSRPVYMMCVNGKEEIP